MTSPDHRAAALAELSDRAARFRSARQELEVARHDLRLAVVEAVAAGVSEAESARVAGVDRMTVRSWLGKGTS